ncbi:MAG: NUDIX domain-containing protein [bacterium]|nr:NUDIX domain-containing protein [bacterium]
MPPKQVACRNLFGESVMVDPSVLKFRPSAYGIILHDGKMLLTTMHSTGKYQLPGGGIDLGETMRDALKREIYEECGIEAEIGEPQFFAEYFFFYDPTGQSSQAYGLYFLCRPLSFDLKNNDPTDESFNPQWVPIAGLTADQFQIGGEQILKIIKKSYERTPITSRKSPV